MHLQTNLHNEKNEGIIANDLSILSQKRVWKALRPTACRAIYSW